MSKLKKTIFILAIAVIGYAITIPPNGRFFIPIAKLIKAKGQVEDHPVHSLDLKRLRSGQFQE